MSAKKLCIDDREIITRKILAHRFDKDDAGLLAQEKGLGDQIYLDNFSQKDRDLMASMPSGWLPMSDQVCAQFGSSGSNVHVLHTTQKFPFPFSKHSLYGHHCLQVYDGGHKFTTGYYELRSAQKALESKKKETTAKINGILKGVSTLKQLLEVWPEVKAFTTFLEDAAPVKLPAVVLPEFNQELGLPPEIANGSQVSV